MKRLGLRPPGILLALVGILAIGYGLFLLPPAVTYLVAGLVCMALSLRWQDKGQNEMPHPPAAAPAHHELPSPEGLVPEVPPEQPQSRELAPVSAAVITDTPAPPEPVPPEPIPPEPVPPEPARAVPAAAEPAVAEPRPSQPPKPRQPIPQVRAKATTYQNGEVTKRTEINLRLGGRRRQ